MPKVYIVVVTYNGEKWIDFFAPEFSVLPEGWQVIVVDNASQDGTVNRLRKEYPHFTVMESGGNIGFGRANNIGLKKALAEQADFVLLLNQDAKISVESIVQLAEVHARHPECLILSPVHLSSTGDDIDPRFVQYCSPEACPNLFADVFQGRAQELYHSRLGNASIWLLSRKSLEVIGGFNPIIHLYGEDDEYRNRVYYHGYKLGIVPGVFAYHWREKRKDDEYKFYFPSALWVLLKPHEELNYKHVAGIFCKGILKELAKGNVRRAASFFPMYARLVAMRGRIQDAKRQTRQQGSTFL